jgi:hypothetical protein
MPALTRSIYLAVRKSRLTQEVSFLDGFTHARRILVRLAASPPHTLFSLYTTAALRKAKRGREIVAIVTKDAKLITDPFSSIFGSVIELDGTPNYGSKSFKALKEQLGNPNFDVFCDLDNNPLPELGILSGAPMRVSYYGEELYPFFNILFRYPEESNLRERSVLITRMLADIDELEQSLPKPQLDFKDAGEWLRRRGLSNRRSYIISSVSVESDSVSGTTILQPEAWQNESAALQASLISSAAFYIGRYDRGFELAYLVGTPSILVNPDANNKTVIPQSPFLKLVTTTIKGPIPIAVIEQAIGRSSL